MAEKIHTFCRICEPQCGLVAEVEGDRIVSLRSDDSNPASLGYSCNKGVKFLQVHQDPDRLDYPMKRINPRTEAEGDFARVSWEQACADIGARLNEVVRRHGDKAIAIYMGNPHAFNSTLLTNEMGLMAGFGIGPRFGAYTIDCANKLVASEYVFGSAAVHPIPDLLHTDFFLCIGGNPAVSHMAIMDVADPMAKLRAIRRRGGRTVFINPRIIESSTPETGDVVQIKPNTDFYFLASVLHELAFNLKADQSRIRQVGANVEELLAYVKTWPVERASAVTDIPAEVIRKLARDFMSAPAASIQMSTGVNMGTQGMLAYWMMQMISLITGNLGRRGGNIHSPGLCPIAQLGKGLPDGGYVDTEFGRLRTVNGQLPTALMAEILESTRHPVKALIVIGGNPILSAPGEQRLRAAFEKLDLIVSLDIYRTATAELADYVLPTKDFLEREDVGILGNTLQLEPHVQYTQAVVPAKGERRDDWWILARLLQAMGRPSVLDDPEFDPFGSVEAMLLYRDLSIEKLKQLPCQTAMLPDPVPADLYDFGVQHANGLIDCCPALLRGAFDSAESDWCALIAEPKNQLKLITRRTGLMVNSWMSNLAAYKKGPYITNPLWMNSRDVVARGLIPGGEVEVTSNHGSTTAFLAIDDKLKAGVVAMSHGWGHDRSFGMSVARRFPGANVNRLSPSGRAGFDPFSMQAHLTGINVEVVASRTSSVPPRNHT